MARIRFTGRPLAPQPPSSYSTTNSSTSASSSTMDSTDQHTTTPPHSPHPLPPPLPSPDSHNVPHPPPQSPHLLPNLDSPLPDPQPLPQPQSEEPTLFEGLGDIQDLGSTVPTKQIARKSIVVPVLPTVQQTVEVLTFQAVAQVAASLAASPSEPAVPF